MNKLLTSHEQGPTVVIIRLETGETTILGVVFVWWFPTVVIIRLHLRPAGDWLVGLSFTKDLLL